jgi:hypothetical protein
MVNLLLWLVPLFVIPLSYCFYRYVPFRKGRYCSYALLLIAAFFLNLFQISFWNEHFDTIELLIVNFVIAEFFWNLRRINRRRFFLAVLIIVLCLYAVEFKRWAIAGPGHSAELWAPAIASTYCRDDVRYAVREHDSFNRKHPVRQLVLTRKLGRLPFEKQVGVYRTPEGFRYTDFTYRWSKKEQGVRLDIAAVGYKLWTMGEGF